jgi:hypothetical protein
MKKLEGRQWKEEVRKRDKKLRIFSGIKVNSLVRKQVIY